MLRFGAATKLSLPAFRRNLATHSSVNPAAGTYNLVEKIVQKYAVDPPPARTSNRATTSPSDPAPS